MLRTLLKAHLTVSVRKAARLLQQELGVQQRHRASVRRARNLQFDGNLQLNLGCGLNLKPGWVNIDLGKFADLQLDLREPFPFPDNSAAFIYSEHVFEHFSYPEEAGHILSESLRVLRPGGVFSIGVPDSEMAIGAYGNEDNDFFRISRDRGWHPAWCTTRMHHLNYHFRLGAEHKYCYDYETLAEILRDSGFVAIQRRSFDAELDSEVRRWGTMYVNAEKPAESRPSEKAPGSIVR
jgi:predicted SAM-dependent methyltransferase